MCIDSLVATKFLTQTHIAINSIQSLMLDCTETMQNSEEVRIQHCYKEGNSLADLLAKVSLDGNYASIDVYCV